MPNPTCLVTGATGALGEAVATGLARAGATVVLAGRDAARTDAVRTRIVAAANNSDIHTVQVDLASQASIRAMADAVAKKYPRLNVLIHTAAVFTSKRIVTTDGLEIMFAVNHLAPFLLTNLLLGTLKANAPARIITVTAPSTTALDFDDLQGERKFSALNAFGASKMANLLFTYALARRLEGTRVTANALHPGLIKSNLMQQSILPMRVLLNLVSGSPEKGADTAIFLATDAQVADETGKFFKDRTPMASNGYSHDTQVQDRLWDLSKSLCKESK